MDLRDYVRVLRRRWRLVLLCLILGVGGAAGYVFTATPEYTASTQLYVAAAGGDLLNLTQGTTLGQEQVQSYAQIVDSPQVTALASTELNGELSAEQIAGEITATAPLNTQLLDLSVTDKDPVRAAAVANAVSEQFARYAEDLNAGANLHSPVKVTVVRRATVPTAPSSPKKPLDLALGLIAGLVIGVGGAVLRDVLDRSVTSPDQIQDLVGLPVLGVIARDPDAVNRPLLVAGDPRSTRSEAFRQLRTNLRFINPDRPPRSLAITSSVPEEGKTTTAANLAITLADAGVRICLVEGDMRRPRLAEYLGVEGAVGLTDVLVGSSSLSDAIQTWGTRQQLHFLPSGALPPNPSELLASHALHELLHELERQFDLVIIDSPPVLPVTDGALLSNAADGALVVVRHGRTRRDQVMRTVDSLRAADVNVFGVTLTFTPTRGPDAYYYGYAYRYDHPAKSTRAVMSEPAAPHRAQPRAEDELLATDELAPKDEPVTGTSTSSPGRPPGIWSNR